MTARQKAYAGHAKRVRMGVWGYLRQFMCTKWGIVVDTGIDAHDWRQAMWALSTRMDPAAIEKVDAMWNELGLPGSGKSTCR